MTRLEESSTSASQLEVSPRNTEGNNEGGPDRFPVCFWNVLY